MSHELLVAAGSGREGAARIRSTSVRNAALHVPGAQTHDFAETPFAAAALVETAPAGGGKGALSRQGDSVQVAVATSAAGVDVALSARPNAEAGSEAGHVIVTMESDGRLTARSDGVGMVPLFWAEIEGQLYISTHLASLVSLGVPAVADTQGMLEYLAMLHPLGERTVLNEAHILPAGGVLTWRPGTRGTVTSQSIFTPSADQMTDDEAVESFRQTWQTVIADILDRGAHGRTALSLSGGLDSRAVAATINALGSQVTCFTYGTQRNRETRTATQIAERLGMPHLTLPLTDDRLLHDAVAGAARIDGAHTPAELYDTWFQDTVRQYADTVINGHAGGPLWGDEKAHGLTDRDQIAERVWGRYAGVAQYIKPFLADGGLAAEFEPAVRGSIRDSLGSWDFTERADMITFWQVANRQTRWGNMLVSALRRGGLQVETPFMDSRFLAFSSRLGASQRRNGSFYLRIHREVFPQTADIGRSDDGNPPNALTHLYWTGDVPFRQQWLRMTADHPVSGLRRGSRRASSHLAALARSKVGISFPADSLDHRASVFPTDLLLRTRPVYAERLAAMLRHGAESSGMLDGQLLADAAHAVTEGRAPAPALILARLATAALWTTDFQRREQQAAAARATGLAQTN